MLGIKSSTAKLIVKKYRKTGSFTIKKALGEGEERPLESPMS
jgi:transposase